MSIQMIGIDHNLAEIAVREKFYFTKSQTAALMEKWKTYKGIQGMVLLSTCNRMEIYVNLTEENEDYCEKLCLEKDIKDMQYRSFFCKREGEEAVRHLFEMTAGLRSLIVGEDQILTQVKDALSFARQEYATDNVLEVLFRQAVTTAKKVKTKAFFLKDISVAGEAVKHLKKQGMTLVGKKCLVIGNGIMGRLTAQALLEEGANVTVTVRQYHKGIVDTPAGTTRIDYGRRYEILPDCDYVFSATSSPNLTITKEGLEGCKPKKNQIFVDLAVPRDMEPAIKELSHVTLYDVDDFALENISPDMEREWKKAYVLIEEGIEEFQNWYECRGLVPIAQKIAALAAEDMCGRLEKPFGKIEEDRRRELLKTVGESGEKVTASLLYALRDELDTDMFRRCLEILERKFKI